MYILAAIAGALGLFVLFVSTRPSAFRIARSLAINATPSELFALINDLHQWPAWSPWEKLDPSMKRTHEGAPAGKGAIYRWSGNNKVGEGVITIVESKPDARVEMQLQFIRPFAATNRAVFTLEPEGAATKVTWEMSGNNAFMAKAFGLFVNMDAMLGKDFISGLEAMKAAVASKTSKASA